MQTIFLTAALLAGIWNSRESLSLWIPVMRTNFRYQFLCRSRGHRHRALNQTQFLTGQGHRWFWPRPTQSLDRANLSERRTYQGTCQLKSLFHLRLWRATENAFLWSDMESGWTSRLDQVGFNAVLMLRVRYLFVWPAFCGKFLIAVLTISNWLIDVAFINIKM